MLPPVESSILASNGKFDALYRDLCTTKLNADGTSRVDAKPQQPLSEELRRARVLAAKKALAKCYLSNLAFGSDELPLELRELVSIMASLLQSQAASDDVLLLRDDVGIFKDNIKPIANALSKEFAADITALSQLISAEDPTGGRDLIGYITDAQTRITTSISTISSLRLTSAQEATKLHALYRKVFETSIRILEQTLHGAVSRHTRAKADYLATVAEGMHKKLDLQQRQLAAQTTHSPEMQAALKARAEDLEREGAVVKRQVREAEERLMEYRGAKALAGLAREYAEIVRETAKVEGDVARLRSGR